MIEAVPEKIGVRRFEMKDGVMCLNGKRIVFHGVNRHEFDCRTGKMCIRDRSCIARCAGDTHADEIAGSGYCYITDALKYCCSCLLYTSRCV